MFQPTPQTHAPHAHGLFDSFAPLRVGATRAEALGARSEAETRAFLSERPVHAVNLLSLVRDNGLVSPHNRGTFYGYRDERGRLEGVALIGHATLFEARTPRALRALARAAQRVGGLHMMLGEAEPVADFWGHYRAGGQQAMRRACRELLFELNRDASPDGGAPRAGVVPRLATLEDLPLVMPVQARMAEAESGVNPLASDPEGFRRRCERRVERGRTWVVTEGGRLVFKAEVMADAGSVVYLEGIHVAEGERGRGRGLECLSWLTGELLKSAGSVCVLVNEQNEPAQALYRRAGFRFAGHYDTVFLTRD
ncbi:MAG: GNAT family N-acetyltransferase [Pyrinomonadaceae bacterium]